MYILVRGSQLRVREVSLSGARGGPHPNANRYPNIFALSSSTATYWQKLIDMGSLRKDGKKTICTAQAYVYMRTVDLLSTTKSSV